jgi:hypothetical protein
MTSIEPVLLRKRCNFSLATGSILKFFIHHEGTKGTKKKHKLRVFVVNKKIGYTGYILYWTSPYR